MAKQKKALPARKAPGRSRVEESVSLRTAESLGRVIGTLQRQLDHAFRRFGEHTDTPIPRRSRTSDESMRSSRRDTKGLREAAAGNGSHATPPKRAARADKPKATRSRATSNGGVNKRAARPK
jgi:hypothetical protein